MRFAEIKRDIFNVPTDQYVLAHCISADAKMGAGVAKEFVEHFPEEHQTIRKLMASHIQEGFTMPDMVGRTYGSGAIVVMVTKERYYNKPDYVTVASALHRLRELSLLRKTTKIAMPKIACGLDKLEWPRVRTLIKNIFSDTNIDIVICHKERTPDWYKEDIDAH